MSYRDPNDDDEDVARSALEMVSRAVVGVLLAGLVLCWMLDYLDSHHVQRTRTHELGIATVCAAVMVISFLGLRKRS